MLLPWSKIVKPDHEVVLLLNFFDELSRRVPLK